MSQPSRRRLRVETTGETGRFGDDCVSQWVKKVFEIYFLYSIYEYTHKYTERIKTL